LCELSSFNFFKNVQQFQSPIPGISIVLLNPRAPQNIQRNVWDDVPLVGCAELQGKVGDVGGEVPCQRRRRGEQENVCDGLVEMTRLRLRLVVRERGREGERERGREGERERGRERERDRRRERGERVKEGKSKRGREGGREEWREGGRREEGGGRLAPPGPLFTPPPPSSPPKTPQRSYSAQIRSQNEEKNHTPQIGLS
jgi:hypothetical protein